MKAYVISAISLKDLRGSGEPSMIQYNLPVEDAVILAQNLLAGVQARLTQQDSNGRVEVAQAYVRLTTTGTVSEVNP